jgi:hypothetical protein
MLLGFLSFLLLATTSPTSAEELTAFQQFTFAPNGVCLSPQYFVDTDSQQRFKLRNVPGEGDCMFQATALAAATSMGLGANDVLLRKIAKETRAIVATILQSDQGILYIQGRRTVKARQLLNSAARDEGLSTAQYLELLQKEGAEGGLYGGGPELTVLSNVLRRPISVYELSNDNESLFVQKDATPYPIVCKGVFGSPLFRDPCLAIPNSAVLQNSLQPLGAYNWHLHLLVVEATVTGERHACVLLPQLVKYG